MFATELFQVLIVNLNKLKKVNKMFKYNHVLYAIDTSDKNIEEAV
ncbi:hypothetical protein [Francisella sp. 19X1-34]|nr:hypothetical protein [Francisella sp. 19X1-34]MED7789536.1 hypothetical protein [Francisella sp. 19X1-34]